ncbi:MAG: Ig-like domain-containing protein [Bacteroidia bacterium]
MIFKKCYFIGSFILVLILCTRCAQIGMLSGGKKDVTPPKLLLVEPHDTSINVSTKDITITFKFDEMIDIKAVSKSLVINPLTDNMPTIRANGKKMILHFDDELQPNTTYQIQFGSSVGDVHENNKYKNLTYIFSTGAIIDTNTVSGKAIDALSLKPVKEVSIMLFADLSDTAATRSKPNYLIKTDTAGKYSLSAIKPGTYQIIAVTDKNNGMTYDAGESIGFINAALTITGKDTVNFIMSTPKVNNNFIKKKIQSFWGYNKFILSDTMPDAYILYEDKNSDGDKIAYETRNDTLEVYYKGIYDSELKLFVKRSQMVIDTIIMEVPKEQKVDSTRNKNGKKISVSAIKKLYGIANDEVTINFSLPVKNIDKDKCLLVHEGITEKAVLTSENKSENNNLVTTYLPLYKKRVLNKLHESQTYSLIFLPNSITNYWDMVNADTIKTTFKTYSNDDIGTLKVKLTLPDSIHNYLVQLLNIGGNLLNEYSGVVKKENIIIFYNLPASDYYLSFINDVDANKKFTPANFTTHTQPEDIFLYDKPIKVPAGWDVEAEWKIILQPEKNK